jgi:hypothetical protein
MRMGMIEVRAGAVDDVERVVERCARRDDLHRMAIHLRRHELPVPVDDRLLLQRVPQPHGKRVAASHANRRTGRLAAERPDGRLHAGKDLLCVDRGDELISLKRRRDAERVARHGA